MGNCEVIMKSSDDLRTQVNRENINHMGNQGSWHSGFTLPGFGFDCSGFPNGNWPGGPPGFGPSRNSTRGFYGPRPHNFPTLGARLLFGPSSQPRWGHPGYY